ncbi:MAG: HDIG domain-containing metalloprotein [Balneolaceae bacterium]
MSILKKLGLAPKRRKGAPNIGENRKKELLEAAQKKNLYLRLVIFFVFMAVVLWFLPQSGLRQSLNYTMHEPWRNDDLTAPFTYALLKSPEEIQEERAEVRQNTPPIFHESPDAVQSMEQSVENAFQNLQPVLVSWFQWQRSRDEQSRSRSADSLRFAQELELSGTSLSGSSLEHLLENYRELRNSGDPIGNFIGEMVRTDLLRLIERLSAQGVINRDKDQIDANELTVRNLDEQTERVLPADQPMDMEEASEWARSQLSQRFDPSTSRLALELFLPILEPIWIYSEEDSQQQLQDALSEISATQGAVAQGQVIVRRGDIVDEEVANMLRSLASARADNATALERGFRFLGEGIILLVTTLFFLFYLFLYRRKIFDASSMFLLVFLVLGLIVIASGIVYQLDDLSPYLVPVAIAPLILTIIFDSRVGLLATITLAIITATYHDHQADYLIATIIACSYGVFSVRDINKRTQFFVTTPLVVFIGYLLVTSGFALSRYGGWETWINQLTWISINSVFILFTYPLILFFEKTFNVTTDFTLLELSDTNLPLLKELMTKAPGTFHHSLQVANLAESAASAIGANALLTRTGALYHDIGKMNKPGYFIENQTGVNEHNKLKPRMSALVIKAHVSDGVKMAKEYDLPETLIKFIQTHHGSSIIRYFYEKAKSEAEQESDVHEEDFRYDGPTPFSRETGILMLADSTEAASRAMKDPTYSKLENLIQRIVDGHLQEGQLDHCPLTLQEIDIIKKSFLKILLGVYHSRIEYPDQEADNAPADSTPKEKKKKKKKSSNDSSTKTNATGPSNEDGKAPNP